MKKIVTVSLISSISLFAATPLINSGNIEKQIQAPKNIPMPEKQSVEIEGIKSNEIIKDFDNKETIFIKDISFSGNTKISTQELNTLLKDYINKDLTFKQMQEAISLINRLYRDRGYFVARAYLAPQDIVKNNNVLKISILEGNYGEFKLENSSIVSDEILQSILDNVKDENIISFNTIERVTNLINDRSGAVVKKAIVSPGQKVGTGDFDIGVEESKRADGYIVADNYGSRYTGYNRLQGLININSPFNIGDKISLLGLVSNGADLKNGKLAYEVPLLPNGLKADFAYSRTNYNLVEEYKNSDYDGNQDIYEVGLSYPIIRTTNENLYIKGKYYHKDMKDYMLNSKYEDKSINSFVSSLEYDKNYTIANFQAILFADLNLTTGHLSSINENPNNGSYNKIDTYITNDIYFNEILSFNTTLSAQKVLGHKNLDGSEDLSLGGPNGVKLYPYSEQSGENGYIATFELFNKLPSINSYNHKIGLFYDIGDVYQEINTDSTFNRTRLKDIGLGYYSSFKDFFLRTQIAWAANSKPVASEYTNHTNSKFLIQTGWVF